MFVSSILLFQRVTPNQADRVGTSISTGS
jgi:hypothetical protein